MSTLARFVRVTAAGLVTALVLGLLAGVSAAPLPFHSGPSARLRLSWSARPERIEICRAATAEALAELEEHMRQRIACEGRFATYTLRVESDGRVIGESVVRGAGLRNDRPVYLLREYDVTPGVHRVRVTFTRREKTEATAAVVPTTSAESDTGIFAGRAQREEVERGRRARAAVPAHLVLDTLLTFAPRRVMVVSFDPERRALTLLTSRGGQP